MIGLSILNSDAKHQFSRWGGGPFVGMHHAAFFGPLRALRLLFLIGVIRTSSSIDTIIAMHLSKYIPAGEEVAWMIRHAARNICLGS
jgi:hypothetical protein